MREISLITGQLHRAIYNLNEDARREANQKFENGLLAAPARSMKRVLDQFGQSLQSDDPLVRQRTASLVSVLVRNFKQLPEAAIPQVLELIDQSLADRNESVREAAIESYSLMLESINSDDLLAEKLSAPAEAQNALHRILELAIQDPSELVREAAAISVGIQKSRAIQITGTDFFLDHCHSLRHRQACRAIVSLSEFPQQIDRYQSVLSDLLVDSDVRYRRSALLAAFRLAKLGAFPLAFLSRVVRRCLDGDANVRAIAQAVLVTVQGTLRRTHPEIYQQIESILAALGENNNSRNPNSISAVLNVTAIVDRLMADENFATAVSAWDDLNKILIARNEWRRKIRTNDSTISDHDSTISDHDSTISDHDSTISDHDSTISEQSSVRKNNDCETNLDRLRHAICSCPLPLQRKELSWWIGKWVDKLTD